MDSRVVKIGLILSLFLTAAPVFAATAEPERTIKIIPSGGAGEPITLTMQGESRYDVAWRIGASDPEDLYFSVDSTAYYRAEGVWASVLPSG